MDSDPDQLLNQLVVAAVTVFVTVSLLLTAFILREIWLQQRVAELSTNLQVNLEELEQTTEEIQATVSEMQATADEAQDTQELAELLETVDEQLATIGESVDEAATVLEADVEFLGSEGDDVEPVTVTRRQADQVFTIFAVLTGVAAISIAAFLGFAMRVQERYPAPQRENGS